MPHESFQHLRVDRRLVDRAGWIARDELQRELDSLPDVADKIAPPEEDDSEPSSGETGGAEA